jgi:hypothetical protein
MTQHIERIARTILWLVISAILIAVPVAMLKNKTEVDSLQKKMDEALLAADEKIQEFSKEEEPKLFSLKKIGTHLSGLNLQSAEGMLTFTNISEETGILCLQGIAENPSTKEIATSLPFCRDIQPFESNITISFQFAGGEIRDKCPKEVQCHFSVLPVNETE